MRKIDKVIIKKDFFHLLNHGIYALIQKLVIGGIENSFDMLYIVVLKGI